MFRICTAVVQQTAHCSMRTVSAPRVGTSCRARSTLTIGFALTLLLVAWGLPVTVAPWLTMGTALASDHETKSSGSSSLDMNFNSIDDTLDRWLGGNLSWAELRQAAVKPQISVLPAEKVGLPFDKSMPADGAFQAGKVRVLHLGPQAGLTELLSDKEKGTHLSLLHDLALGSGVQVLAVDPEGLRSLLTSVIGGRLLLDRCGTPALATSRPMIGLPKLANQPWGLGQDWSASIAILDSGCDTAHGDLGDVLDDDIDGPPPLVGDAGDWFSAAVTWPLATDFKVIGWHDVTDDFPFAAGPWDYHYHGTALASIVAGSGQVDPALHGVAAGARLTVVKFYDFDGQWRTWAGDFLAACAWTLDHADTFRVKTVLCAVNWEQDLGISEAMTAFVEAGIVPVVAMGNQGQDFSALGFPARLTNVLTVGAVNDQGAVSAFSGRGGDTVLKPDIVAPGGGLLPALGRIEAADNEPNDSYSGRVGTSLAAAHAAGAVYLLYEALRATGLAMPKDIFTVKTLLAILKFTCAPVDVAETSNGQNQLVLSPQSGPDTVRGWGLLRVDAAVEGLRESLAVGGSGRDTLGTLPASPVMVRRLMTSADVAYTIEAVPVAGLDISLEVFDPRWLDDDPEGASVLRVDEHGPGGRETLVVTGPADSWLLAAVKLRGGQGECQLLLNVTDEALGSGNNFFLPGVSTGEPNSARLGPGAEVSLVIPSRVLVDPLARVLNVTDLTGQPRPGWPVFLFPHSSSLGGIGQPLAWDLDGIPGDEIVAASDFGSVYFLTGSGSVQEVKLTLNLPLTAPVGLVTANGAHLVAVADQTGVVRTWSFPGVAQKEIDLGHSHPLAPAVGLVSAGGGETLVVACRDGFVAALDADLNILPGWPQDTGQTLALPPVLLDRNGDGLYEIVVPLWSGSGDPLRLRIYNGDGTPMADDGIVLNAPSGGNWLFVAPPAVGGGYGLGGVNLDFIGLMDNGATGVDALWQLGRVTLTAAGVSTGEIMSGIQIQASTDQSTLVLNQNLWSTPLEYISGQGSGNQPEVLLSLHWQDLLYGLSTMPGSVTGWFQTGIDADPLAMRQTLDLGGVYAVPWNHLGSLLIQNGGRTSRVQILDDQVAVQPLANNSLAAPYWLSARADGRNTGAASLRAVTSAVARPAPNEGPLLVFPNPGGDRIFFSLKAGQPDEEAVLEIFDLRGRRLLTRTLPLGDKGWFWDGRNSHGQRLPTGLYFASVRMGSEHFSTRITLAH